MKTILSFVPNYFPGYMSGGIARTILNTSGWLGDEFSFRVATRDRDLGSDVPYPDVELGAWNALGKSGVRYLAPSELSMASLADFVNATDHDVLHLNSFFDSVFTIKLLLLRRLGRIRPKVVILSPRGEFVPGPLSIKYPKKKLYIELSKRLGFYRDVLWHASSPHEAEGIAKAMALDPRQIRLAIDLPVTEAAPAAPSQAAGGPELKLIFLSRITREKNLDGALRILQGVRSALRFDIVGPREDPAYWNECAALMQALPKNIEARYLGPIAPDRVFDTLGGYDAFLFPSHGENYAHVIAESISVGTRVLVSQFTPWRGLAADGTGWDLPLADPEAFVQVIEELAASSPADKISARRAARAAAATRLSNPAALEENRVLYLDAIQKPSPS